MNVFKTFQQLAIGFEIWPKPAKMIVNKNFYVIDSNNFIFYLRTNGTCDLLEKAVLRYTERMFAQDCSHLNEKFRGRYFFPDAKNISGGNYIGSLASIRVEVEDDCETTPNQNMNEEYFIEISDNIEINSLIHSKSVWGSIRALETFSQMIVHIGKDQFKLNSGRVDDFPRFSFRGFLLDTARHFIPLRSIYEMLDAMEMNKLNVFHWHIVDDQSFPFVSYTFPELSKKGAYKQNYTYNLKDVNDVIQYASERGIRVIPEFDTPGHTLSWGKGQPNLLTECFYNNQSMGEKEKTKSYGPMNPIIDSTYEFLEEFFREIVKRFPDQYLHLGGDEVDFTCWQTNPDIIKFMKKMNFNDDYAKLESYFVEKLINIVQKLNRSYLVWQEVFDNNVKIRPETVVHVWKNPINHTWKEEMEAVTSAGYQALLSSCWYLNYIKYGTDWYDFYRCDPQDFSGTEKSKQLVMGGEICMWSEYVDASNLISRTW